MTKRHITPPNAKSSVRTSAMNVLAPSTSHFHQSFPNLVPLGSSSTQSAYSQRYPLAMYPPIILGVPDSASILVEVVVMVTVTIVMVAVSAPIVRAGRWLSDERTVVAMFDRGPSAARDAFAEWDMFASREFTRDATADRESSADRDMLVGRDRFSGTDAFASKAAFPGCPAAGVWPKQTVFTT